MKKSFSTVLAAFAIAAMLGTAATPALADSWGHGHGGHGGHGHGGFGFRGYYGYGFGLGYYGYPWDYGYYGYGPYGYPYGYPYGSPYDYSAAAPPVQTQPTPPAQSFWYFCRSANAYYPYVASCHEAWQRVPTTPPQG